MKYEFKDRKMIHEGGEFNKFSPREVFVIHASYKNENCSRYLRKKE